MWVENNDRTSHIETKNVFKVTKITKYKAQKNVS